MEAKLIMEGKLCYTAVMDSEGGFTAGIVKEGGLGYFATDWHWKVDYATASKLCEERNEKLGISKKEALMMVLKSMRSHGARV